MINVGIIGCGRIADLHYLGYRDNPDARVLAVCDSNAERAEERRVAWGAERAYTDYRDLLHNPDVDAVEVLTPYETHEPIVIEALTTEKHVAVQKPMTTSMASANRMIDAARTANQHLSDVSRRIVLKVTECYVLYPPIALAKKLIESGEIGEPLGMRMKYVSGPTGGWHVPPSTYEQQIHKASLGFGLETFDHGHHMWATAWYLLGGVERVSAWIDSVDGLIDCPAVIMWKCRDAKRYGTCDYLFAPELEIPSKYYSNDEWFEITGSKGIIQVHQATGNLRPGPAVSLFNNQGWRHFTDVPSDWSEGFIASTRNFIGAILGKESPLLTPEQGREVLQFALAIARSARERREVYLDEPGVRIRGHIPNSSFILRPSSVLYSWRRRRSERKEVIVGPRPRFNFSFGGGSARYAPRAVALTERLAERFAPDENDGAARAEWQSVIGLHLTAEGGVKDEFFAIRVENDKLTIGRGALPADAVLTLHVPAGLWAAILLGKKRLEWAVLGGKIKYEGRVEEGLKFRAAFKI